MQGDDGERITALAAMAERMVPQLTAEQRERLRRTLAAERPRFGDDRSRHNVADRIEAALR